MCDKVFLNSRETAVILGVPVSTLRWWSRKDWYGYKEDEKKLQPARIGSRLYYHKDDIETFIQEVRDGKHAG